MLVYFFYKLTNDLFVTQIDLRSCMPWNLQMKINMMD
jgi:hypothetical protein